VQFQQQQDTLHYLDQELAAREAERDSWRQRAEAAEAAYQAELQRSRVQQQRHAGDQQQVREDRQAALEEQQALLDALQSRDKQVGLMELWCRSVLGEVGKIGQGSESHVWVTCLPRLST
jgi:hypothetical protein